jgi:hypothetical protein
MGIQPRIEPDAFALRLNCGGFGPQLIPITLHRSDIEAPDLDRPITAVAGAAAQIAFAVRGADDHTLARRLDRQSAIAGAGAVDESRQRRFQMGIGHKPGTRAPGPLPLPL